jgi:pimeloyl-ACP methyl ester carboxylesterase
MIDLGTGTPLVLVPGIQGRWEWMRPTVQALANHFRVLSFSLAGERTSGHVFDAGLGFDNFIVQVDRVLAEAGVSDAVLCGVSYGGLIAARYAALRPERVRALVLASALAPGYTPDARVRFYLRAPWLLSPLFCVNAWRRSRREIRAALPTHRDRLAFSAGQLWRVAAHPTSPALMRDRIRLLEGVDFVSSMSSVVAPTLLITGESALDSVVPPQHTLGYTRFLPHAESLTFERTGHIGVVTRPVVFADRVAAFVARTVCAAQSTPARRVAGGP